MSNETSGTTVAPPLMSHCGSLRWHAKDWNRNHLVGGTVWNCGYDRHDDVENDDDEPFWASEVIEGVMNIQCDIGAKRRASKDQNVRIKI